MAGFNVQRFKSVMEGNKGLLPNNRFLVEVPVPKKLRGIITDKNTQDMSFFIKAMPLPGIGILTQDVYRYGYGPIERKPYGTIFNDAMMQCYIDGNNVVRGWFRNWIRLIANPDTSKGINSKFETTGQSAYEFSYKEDYAVDVRVTAYSREGSPVISIVLVECYPNYVGDVLLDWQDKNSGMIMPVSMTYRDWYEETIHDNGSMIAKNIANDELKSDSFVKNQNESFTSNFDDDGNSSFISDFER